MDAFYAAVEERDNPSLKVSIKGVSTFYRLGFVWEAIIPTERPVILINIYLEVTQIFHIKRNPLCVKLLLCVYFQEFLYFIQDKPMAVGSMGMLTTSNYLARKFGVRAAMPGFIGKKLCPQLTIVPPNFEKYTAVSKVVRDVFREYDPEFCPVSLDEAYLVK